MAAAAAASVRRVVSWRSLGISARELRCDVTLTNGQAFNWRPHRVAVTASASAAISAPPSAPPSAPVDEWVGVMGQRVVILKQTADDTLFRLPKVQSVSAARAIELATAAAAAAAATANPSPKKKQKSNSATAIVPVPVPAGGGGGGGATGSGGAAAAAAAAASATGTGTGTGVSVDSTSPLTADESEVVSALKSYFQCQYSLEELSGLCSRKDPNGLGLIAPSFAGLRMLQIDPVRIM